MLVAPTTTIDADAVGKTVGGRGTDDKGVKGVVKAFEN